MAGRSRPKKKDQAPIKVYCLPEERAVIEANARATGLSKSVYLLRVGMGTPIPSIVDHERIEELLKINGDVGRLGGLLKLWLSREQSLQGIDARTVRTTLKTIEATQDTMMNLLRTVLRPKAEPPAQRELDQDR